MACESVPPYTGTEQLEPSPKRSWPSQGPPPLLARAYIRGIYIPMPAIGRPPAAWVEGPNSMAAIVACLIAMSLIDRVISELAGIGNALGQDDGEPWRKPRRGRLSTAPTTERVGGDPTFDSER